MRAAFIAGRGLASSLGPDLASALRCLAAGGVAPRRVEVAPGQAFPVFVIDEAGDDWHARSRAIVRRVAAESGALSGPRTGPLFVGSSSLDIGAREREAVFDGDTQTLADDVAAWLDWRGPAFTVCTACTSSMNALLSAVAWVRAGRDDEALVLGLELRNRVSVGGFAGMQLLAPSVALPMGRAREGLVLGEAAAALRVTAAPARWRVAGGANVVDGQDPAGAVPSAVRAMCAQAMAASGIGPGDIGLVKPQAAGSVANDAIEVGALREVFERSPLPPLVSFKASIGHTLGAAGAAEVALLTACLEAGVVPRVGYEIDEALGVRLVEQAPRGVRHVLASILGFGGGHAAVVLEDRGA